MDDMILTFQKNYFIYSNKNPFKMMKKCLLFHLKSSLRAQDI